jgi:hypothetical protein
MAAEVSLGASALERLGLGGSARHWFASVSLLTGAAARDPVDGEAADDAFLPPGFELDLPHARNEGVEHGIVDPVIGVSEGLGALLVAADGSGAAIDVVLLEGLGEGISELRPVEGRVGRIGAAALVWSFVSERVGGLVA